jgi:hypothetical protein
MKIRDEKIKELIRQNEGIPIKDTDILKLMENYQKENNNIPALRGLNADVVEGGKKPVPVNYDKEIAGNPDDFKTGSKTQQAMKYFKSQG